MRERSRDGEPSEREWRRAARYLAAAMPPGALRALTERVARREWPALHLGARLVVRDLMRRGGFDWDERYLDDHWLELALKAAERATEPTEN
jgi:hypothetical protein